MPRSAASLQTKIFEMKFFISRKSLSSDHSEDGLLSQSVLNPNSSKINFEPFPIKSVSLTPLPLSLCLCISTGFGKPRSYFFLEGIFINFLAIASLTSSFIKGVKLVKVKK